MSCIGIRYISAEDIISINNAALSFTPGEISGFINKNSLEPSQQAPSLYRYYEQCEDIFTLAAVLYIKINKSHIFQNANKRTAFMASVVFLRINGFIFEPDTESSIDIALRVANNEPSYDDPKMLSSWFKAFCRVADDSFDLDDDIGSILPNIRIISEC
ncbi:type II toxin-antitoxin system death-on-curing family toxin [Vibrio diabolicus]|uniref:type II toxin-antitoxin system death-on-curing family toxin n=1 Tax=Vibrio diabolicus TaxID=50719 RepID=UPI002940E900|nr:type II toxin-antitoxin system death-on-curing family toxin [Vibrio diabolicus]MDV5045356.1 type II toxin-antitoxin system death-on-curing family toxin [Vibrio diabolicus]